MKKLGSQCIAGTGVCTPSCDQAARISCGVIALPFGGLHLRGFQTRRNPLDRSQGQQIDRTGHDKDREVAAGRLQ
jgi:hypothetical protein